VNDCVAVIGSGVAGSITAAILAKLGSHVILVEKAQRPSPLVRSFRRGSSLCDVGFHYTGGLGDGGFLRLMFDRLGILKRLEPVALDVSGFDRIVWPENGRELRVPSDNAAFEERLCEAFPSSEPGVRKYGRAVHSIASSHPFLNPTIPPWEMALTPDSALSLDDVLVDLGVEPALIDFLGSYGEVLYGLNAREVSFQLHCLVLGSYMASVHTLRGGGLALAEAFSQCLSELGVAFLGGRAASRITLDAKGHVMGVVLSDGETIAARTVVVTSHPGSLLGLLGPQAMSASYRARLEAIENTGAMFLSFVRVPPGTLRDLQNCYLFCPPCSTHLGRTRVLAVMAGAPCLQGDTPCRTVMHGVSDEDISWLRSAPPEPDYVSWKKQISGLAVDCVTTGLQIRRDALEVIDTATPRTLETWTGSPGGAAYGAKRKLGQRALRPRTPIGGIFLAGQGLLAPGILGAAASAVVACSHVAGADAVWRALFR